MAKHQVTIPIFIPHCGCPHTCAFCNQWMMSSARAVPDQAYIDATVAKYTSRLKPGVAIVELAFFGGSFTGIPQDKQVEFLAAAAYYLEQKIIQGIRLSTRPDYITMESLALLKKYGVTTVEVGVQSFDDRALIAANRGHSAKQAHDAIMLLREQGFTPVIQLMPGLPGADCASDLESAEIAASLQPEAVRIYPTIVLKGTALEKMYNSDNYVPLELDKAINLCKDIYTILTARNIPIIRLGIHPLSEQELCNIIAGPYHPAFGFLVKCRLKRDILENIVREYLEKNPAREITIALPEKEREEYFGYKRENLGWLKERFGLDRVVIVPGYPEGDALMCHPWIQN